MKLGQPIAVDGSLVDVRNVNTHKCVRLVVDVPAERAAAIIAAFGWPTMVDPVPVVVARLGSVAQLDERPASNGKDAGSSPVGAAKRSWSDLSPAQQSGIRCSEESFQRFLREIGGSNVVNDTEAAAYVRFVCHVKSRAEITPGSKAHERWIDLEERFQVWLADPAPDDLRQRTEVVA